MSATAALAGRARVPMLVREAYGGKGISYLPSFSQYELPVWSILLFCSGWLTENTKVNQSECVLFTKRSVHCELRASRTQASARGSARGAPHARQTLICGGHSEEGCGGSAVAWKCHETKCDAPMAFPSLGGKLGEVLRGLSACWASFEGKAMIDIVSEFEATFLGLILKSIFSADLDVSRRALSDAIFKFSQAALQLCLFSDLSIIGDYWGGLILNAVGYYV